MNATDQLIRTYTEHNYVHTATVCHRGVVVAFAMDAARRLWYAVLHLEGPDGERGIWDVKHWPETPRPLPFVSEIAQVGYSVAGATSMPLVRLGSGQEAAAGTLLPEEVDPFASSTARLTAAEPFQVFSDQKHICVFRQSISVDHEHAVFKLAEGGASSKRDAHYVIDAEGRRIPVVGDTLLCDRYVLSGAELKNKREIRYRRSRNKSLPASGTDSLGASDMEGRPFYEPTQELAFIRHLHGGRFTVLQLPTTLQDVKRWQIFAANKETGRLDSVNLEVSEDGLFDPLGTQLYTSPEAHYRGAVLEREPGLCPLSGKELVPVVGSANFAETGLSFDGGSQHVLVPGARREVEHFCVELWVSPTDLSFVNGTGLFASTDDPLLDGGFQIEAKEGRWCLRHADALLDLGPLREGWQHLAVSYDGAALRGYQGGELASEVLVEEFSVLIEAMRLANNRAGDSALRGVLDEVRLWDRPRAADEIKTYSGQRLIGQEPGLVAYYRLDEGSGTTVYDQTDRAQHGEIIGEPTWVSSDAPVADHAGIRRSSFRLVPPASEVSTPATAPEPSPEPEPEPKYALHVQGASMTAETAIPEWNTSRFSLELWVKPSTTTYIDYTSVFSTSDGAQPNTFQLEVHDGSWRLDQGAEVVVSKLAPVRLGWQHLALSYDGTHLKGYVDGEEVFSQRHDGLQARFKLYRIGVNRGGTKSFDGAIEEVRLWSRVRTQAEIQAQMNRRLTGTEEGLRGYWPLSEGNGSTAEDRSSYGHHLTLLKGARWTQSDSPVGADARGEASAPQPVVLKALDFDGVHDLIEVEHSLPFTSQVTVEMWMKGGPSQPEMGFLFYFTNDGNHRLFSAHAPWSDGVLYFDGGGDSSGNINRISQQMDSSEQKGSWNHWAFVRDSVAGRMAVYKNGALWLEQSWGQTRSMSGCTRFIIAARHERAESHAGSICEFRVWDAARSEAQIRGTMNLPILGAAPGLIASYALGESGDCLDRSGNGRHGTIVGSPTVVDPPSELVAPTPEASPPPPPPELQGEDPQPSTALRFDGADDYLTAERPLLNDLSAFTLEGWVKLAQQGVQMSLFGQNDSVEIGTDSSGRLMCWLGMNHSLAGRHGTTLVDTAPIPAGSWQHVAFTADRLKLRIYLNGALRVEIACNADHRGASNDPFCVGGYVWTLDRIVAFKGEMAELRLWDHARDTDQLRTTMDHVLLGDEPGLLGYWQLQREVSGDIPDLAGTAPVKRVSSPSWVSTDKQLQDHPSAEVTESASDSSAQAPITQPDETQPSTALRFDGVDDYLTSEQPLLSDRDMFTVEGWIKRDSQSKRVGLFGQHDAVQFGIDAEQKLACWLNTEAGTAPPVDAAVVLYQDRSYGGASQSLTAGRYDIGALSFGNDQLSSLRVPTGMRATIWQHQGFRGSRVVYTEDCPQVGVDNDASSIEVEQIASSTSGIVLADSEPLAIGSWQHVALTCDGLKLRLYVNGALRAESSFDPAARRTSDAPFCLGGRVWGADAADAFKGEMVEVRLWDHARSADRLRARMGQVLRGDEQGLLAYWQVQTQVSGDIPDLSGSAPIRRVSAPDWVSTDKQLESSSFGGGLDGAAAGMSAALYFQQESALSAEGAESAPFKKRARVMLALNVTGSHGSSSNVAALDFGVARDGRLALVPDTLPLSSLMPDAEAPSLEQGLAMPLLHTDPRGLTLSGALLGFAPSSHRPTLNESATGKLGLYFRHSAGTSSVAYFDTKVERLRLALPTEGAAACHWLSRSASSETEAISVTVSDGSTADTCTVTLEASERALTETWRELPRDASQAAAVINGRSDAGYDLAQATISDASLQLLSGSILLQALPAESDVRLANGTAELLRGGRTGRWTGDGPGEAMDFMGAHVLTRSEGIEAASLPNRLTLEAWVQPHAGGGGGTVVLHSDGETAYAMALHAEGDDHYPVVGVKTGVSMPWQWRQGMEVLPEGMWHHLTLRFEQSYGLRFSGRSQLAVAHAAALDLSADMTIEVGVQLDALSGMQLLLAKGGASAEEAESLPYALLVDATGRLIFSFESERGKLHTFASNARLGTGFHRVAVTRKTGRSERQSSESQDLSYLDQEGSPQTMPATMIHTMDEDPWYEIAFHIDGQHESPHRYEGQRPLGNGQPLMIGGDGLSRHVLGTLCEVRLWKTARDTRAVNRPVGRRERGLVAWWKFQEGRGNVAYDAQGSHHGRLIASEWVKSPEPGASRLDLWHNGLPTPSQAPSSTVRSTLSGGSFASPEPQLSLGGALKAGELDRALRGGIEEVRIWRTLRGPEQVVDNLFGRLKGDTQDLLAYYPFDVDSTATEATSVLDHSLRGLHLSWPTEARRPRVQPSSAPIGHDMPSVRSALTGVDTRFHLRTDTAASVEEYGDLQQDARGNTFGVLKRAYSFLEGGHWHLFTGYKIGDLVSEWIGQAQFDPQVVGYLEGIPPVPSENMTEGQMDPRTMNWADIGLMASVELTESDSVSYTLSSSTEGSQESAFEMSANVAFDNDFMISIAPLGFGKVVKAVEVEASVGVSGSFSSEGGWSGESSLGAQVNRTRTLAASMGGSWESPDPAEQLNPDLGRRLLVGNVGFALVQSETADVYAMRLRHTKALVSFRMVPNPDIPKDWNVISFPINPLYTKQGTLDGRIGFDKDGSAVYDPDYKNATGYGEYSYYKPKEAYALQRRIQQEEQQRLHYFATKGVDEKKFKGNKMGSLAGQAASLILKDLEPDTAKLMDGVQQSMGGSEATFQHLPAQHSKRNIVNTYVWTSDGGFYEEEMGTTDTRTESTGGNFSFSSSHSLSGSMDLKVFGIGMGMEMEASMNAALSVTRTRSREAEKSFGLDVELDVPGDLQRYSRSESGDWVADGNNYPGKVDAYRFKTFYLDSDKRNYEDLFGKVVDPMWLHESNDPAAVALRQAQNADKKPACWRVFHRVTFVSRVLPDYVDATVAPLESAMQAQNIGSNWQLIKTIEPFVKNKTADPIAFADAVRQALRRYLPELLPHEESIQSYLRLYYGVV